MKLEMKHLAPYLPYGLKFESSKHQVDYGNSTIFQMNGLNLDDDGSPNVEFLHNGKLWFSNSMRPVKPILFSLTSLIKEISVNGETFLPIHPYVSWKCS